MTVLALKEQSSLLPTKCALFKTYIIRLVLGPAGVSHSMQLRGNPAPLAQRLSKIQCLGQEQGSQIEELFSTPPCTTWVSVFTSFFAGSPAPTLWTLWPEPGISLSGRKKGDKDMNWV